MQREHGSEHPAPQQAGASHQLSQRLVSGVLEPTQQVQLRQQQEPEVHWRRNHLGLRTGGFSSVRR